MATLKEQFDAVKALIDAKRYAEARKALAEIEHPTAREWEKKLDALDIPEPDAFSGSGSKLPDGITQADRNAARMKSYTAQVVVVIVLYLFLFIPGLIANVIFHNEGKRMEAIAGQPLPGVAALGFMRKWLFVILVIALVLLVVFLIPLLRG